MPATSAELVDLLDIETLDVNLFRGRQPETTMQRVFGGQVAAQALLAATRTIGAEYSVHSLHSYFLHPGDTKVPIIYDVEAIRDGRSFGTRRVVARQHGRAIYFMTANFQQPEEGLEHQDSMPQTPAPEAGIDLHQLFGERGAAADEWEREWAALDVRYVGSSADGSVTADGGGARSQLWIRVSENIGDDPILHSAAFTYASDMTLLGATLVPHDVYISSPGTQAASLDHTIWFHRPFRADEWWLYDQWSPSASGGRGLAWARVFSQDGTLVASVAQEGLIRVRGA